MQLSRVNRSVADRLHSAAIRLLRRLRREDEAMGLTAARASALSVLVFGGRPITLGALAQAEQVSAPTITRLIVGMERDGLVRREADAARRPRRLAARDARKARGCCTPAGAAASPRSRRTWRACRRPSARRSPPPPRFSSACCDSRDAASRHGQDRRRGNGAGWAGWARSRTMMRVVPSLSRALLMAPPPMQISARSRSLQPGELVVLSIVAAGGLGRDHACARSIATSPAYRDGDRTWRALVGIDLDVKPGTYRGDGRRGRRRRPHARELRSAIVSRASSARGG